MSNIKSVLDVIRALLNTSISVTPIVPPPLILVGGAKRPGMNARAITTRIINRKSEAGAPVGPLPSGTQSVDEKMERIRVEEIIKSLISEAKITIVIPAGTPVTTVGGNAGGPVVSQGVTTNYTQGYGIIQ
jgi:hypothetical protein